MRRVAPFIWERTMPNVPRTAASLVVLSAALVVIGGCRAGPSDATIRGLQRINLEVIERLDYEPGNMFDPPRVDIYLVHGADDRMARDLWCHGLLSSGFSPDFTRVLSSDEQGGWPAPSDCGRGADDGDVPAPTFEAY